MADMTVIDRPHSRVSPSSFARFEACTASYWLGAQAPPRESSSYALRGTALHHVFEYCVRDGLDTYELGDLRSVEVDGAPVAVDDDDLDQLQDALNWVRRAEVLRDRRVEVEQTLTLDFAAQHLGEPMYGYADLLARERFPVVVVDLKTGSQPVAADSAQLAIYLLAAVLSVTGGSLEGRDGVAGVTVVLQPRTGGDVADEHEWTWTDLQDVRDRVIDTLRKLKRGVYEYKVTEACRWCPAIGVCPHLAAASRDYALTMSSPSPELVASGELTAERLDELLGMIPVIDAKVKALQRVAEDYLVNGGHLANHKLVRKRANRRWVDPDDEAVAASLRDLGVDPHVRKLKSPAQAEASLPRARRSDVSKLAETPKGGLTVAPRNDPRSEVEVNAAFAAHLEQDRASRMVRLARDPATGDSGS